MTTEAEDSALLRDYVANQSEAAFRTLVERHVDMVYATALRQIGDAHLAEEATQAVFIALARKARGLSSSTILAGWLFRAAQFAAAKVHRAELRRKHWELQAAQMELNTSDSAAAWLQMAPQLNEALNELKEPDRDALLLRFFESKTMAQVGSALGTSEGAAKMRIARALEQLRGIFQTRGVVLPVTVLAAALSTATTQAAPAGLAAAIATSAFLKSTTTIPLLTKGLFLLMNWNARKLAITTIVVLSLSTATSTSLAVLLWKQSQHRATVPVPPPPAEPEVASDRKGGPDDLDLRPDKDGTLRVRTPDGDFVVTNGANHIVTTDDQGRTRELTIVTDENGRSRRMSVRAFRGAPGGPARGRAGAGFGADGGPEGGDEGVGGKVKIEDDVVAPPTPAKP